MVFKINFSYVCEKYIMVKKSETKWIMWNRVSFKFFSAFKATTECDLTLHVFFFQDKANVSGILVQEDFWNAILA